MQAQGMPTFNQYTRHRRLPLCLLLLQGVCEMKYDDAYIARELQRATMSLTDDLVGLTEKCIASYANIKDNGDADDAAEQARRLIKSYRYMIKCCNDYKRIMKAHERLQRKQRRKKK